MNRTLFRRVDAARQYFADEIMTAELQQDRLRGELSQSELREKDLREQYSELVSSSNTQISRLTERLSEVEEANSALQRAEERSRSDMEATLHEQLELLKTKHTRLESEHRILKKESCKMEVLTRTLQRDVQRAQSLYSSEAHSRGQLDNEISAIKKSSQELLAENETLKEKIQQLQMENEELRKNELNNKVSAEGSATAANLEVSSVKHCNTVPTDARGIESNGVIHNIVPAASDSESNVKLSAETNINAASDVAIDAVMYKLREWTERLGELEDSGY